jgi:2-polyprenyl-3-methyl-5-hydroxy-6-metoxy-1,4-benzoquinol methylase
MSSSLAHQRTLKMLAVVALSADSAFCSCYVFAVPDQSSANRSTASLLHAKAWAEAYELIDLQLSALGLRAIEARGSRAGNIVLDVGCGTGQHFSNSPSGSELKGR